jgi:hypothetical protein
MPDAGARGDIGAWTAFPQLIIREKGHDHVYSKTLGIIVIVQSSGFQNKSAVVAGTIKFELGRALWAQGERENLCSARCKWFWQRTSCRYVYQSVCQNKILNRPASAAHTTEHLSIVSL